MKARFEEEKKSQKDSNDKDDDAIGDLLRSGSAGESVNCTKARLKEQKKRNLKYDDDIGDLLRRTVVQAATGEWVRW